MVLLMLLRVFKVAASSVNQIYPTDGVISAIGVHTSLALEGWLLPRAGLRTQLLQPSLSFNRVGSLQIHYDTRLELCCCSSHSLVLKDHLYQHHRHYLTPRSTTQTSPRQFTCCLCNASWRPELSSHMLLRILSKLKL